MDGPDGHPDHSTHYDDHLNHPRRYQFLFSCGSSNEIRRMRFLARYAPLCNSIDVPLTRDHACLLIVIPPSRARGSVWVGSGPSFDCSGTSFDQSDPSIGIKLVDTRAHILELDSGYRWLRGERKICGDTDAHEGRQYFINRKGWESEFLDNT